VLHGHRDRDPTGADAVLRLSRRTMDALVVRALSLTEALASGDVEIEGDADRAAWFFTLLDTFDRWFPIVTP